MVKECPIELNGFLIVAELKFLPLASYDALIGMDWLENPREKVHYYAKIVESCDDEGMYIEIKGVP